jgi:hypothetical protein
MLLMPIFHRRVPMARRVKRIGAKMGSHASKLSKKVGSFENASAFTRRK